jgi:hypothetical protein
MGFLYVDSIAAISRTTAGTLLTSLWALPHALERVACFVVSRHFSSYQNTLQKLIWISPIPGEVFGIIHFCGRDAVGIDPKADPQKLDLARAAYAW